MILHWSTTGLLLRAHITDGDVTNAPRDPTAMRMEAYLRSGVVAGFVLRLVWMHRFNGGASRLPAALSAWPHRMSRLTYYCICLCAAAVVATGVLILAALI